MSPSIRKLSTLVSALAIAGAVAYRVAGEKGALSLGMSQAFAAEETPKPDEPVQGIPAALKGFKGMMTGKLVEKGKTSFTFKLATIKKVWKGNKAKEPQKAVGLTLRLSLRKVSAHHGARIMKNYRGLKNGDAIELEAFDLGGSTLCVKEWLKKVE